MSLNFAEKYVGFCEKKKKLIITIIIAYAWMRQNKQDSEFASGPK